MKKTLATIAASFVYGLVLQHLANKLLAPRKTKTVFTPSQTEEGKTFLVSEITRKMDAGDYNNKSINEILEDIEFNIIMYNNK